MELKGIEYLRNKQLARQQRVLTRYKYYEMKSKSLDPSPIIPNELKLSYNSVLGWCGKAVDCLADRLHFIEFDNDALELNGIFRVNNPDVLFDNAILSALISSCCFIYIQPQGAGETPRLQVIDGGNATGEIDQTTGLLTEGYAVLQRDRNYEIILEAYFSPGQITVYDKKQKDVSIYNNKAEYPLLVPVIYRPDAVRPFGHSRISRACMNIQDKARHTLTRADVSAEFYSFPQRYVLGLDEDAERFNNWKQTITAFLDFRRSEESDKIPSVGQFTQQSMEPHISQLRMYASTFAAETGLTLDDMGFPTENPSSSEAIKAAHENLRLAARKAQRNFSTGFVNAGFLAACVRDDYAYSREIICDERAVWAPIFEPDMSAISLIGDGISKLSQAAPGYMGADNLREMTGIEPSKEPFPTPTE